jgi:copper resistance protein D
MIPLLVQPISNEESTNILPVPWIRFHRCRFHGIDRLVGSVSSLLNTLYGQILLGKLALFAAMLVLAAANRFWLVPRMIETREVSAKAAVWLGRLRYHVVSEQFLGLMVLLAVSVLGTMRPAVGQ